MNDPQTNQIRHGAVEVVRTLRGQGFIAYFAGGCVRDEVLGRPAKDYDIATSATPDEVEAAFERTHAIGKSFGVIQVMWNDHPYEVATFRQDREYLDGRRPQGIVPSTPDEDAQRRDFTINGMFLDPADNRVIDFVGGRADIHRRVIRAIGDPVERFEEDHLRMLRAVRFAATLGFAIEPATMEAIRHHAPKIVKVSCERIQQELTRLLTEAMRPGDAVEVLRESGLLAQVLPEALPMVGQEQPPQFHPEGDVWTHTRLMLDLAGRRDPRLMWAILLHDIGKPGTASMGPGADGVPRIRFDGHDALGAKMAEDILTRLRFSNDDRRVIRDLVALHMRFGQVRSMRRNTLRRILGEPEFDLHLELHRVDCMGSHRLLDNHAFLEAAQAEFAAEPALPEPLVTGADLLALGVPAGKEIGRLKKLAYDLQLNGEAREKAELLERVMRL